MRATHTSLNNARIPQPNHFQTKLDRQVGRISRVTGSAKLPQKDGSNALIGPGS